MNLTDRVFYAVLDENGQPMGVLAGSRLVEFPLFLRESGAQELLDTRAWFDRNRHRVAAVRVQEVQVESEESR